MVRKVENRPPPQPKPAESPKPPSPKPATPLRIADGFDRVTSSATAAGAPGAFRASASPQVSNDRIAQIQQFVRAHQIGQPVDNGGGTAVHDWDGVAVQDFSGGPETEGRCMVAAGPSGAHLVRNDFYKHYLDGANHKLLGAPIDDEHWENGKVVQHFERGSMAWSADAGTTVTLGSASNPGPTTPPSNGAAAQRIQDFAAHHNIGQPFDNGGGAAAHDWNGLTVQDFSGGAETNGHCMVVDSSTGPHLLRNDFYNHYLQGDTHVRLGAPIDDEHGEGGDVVQHFEHGTMRWNPSTGTTVTVDGAGPVIPPQGPPTGNGGVYEPFQVAPGAVIDGRLGADWPAGADVNDTINKMKSLGVRYTCILSPDASDSTIRALQQAGITPVVRLYIGTSPATWSDQDIANMASQAQHLASIGVKLIQVGNEPNHGQESHADPNKPWDWDGYENQSIARQVAALKAVKNAVGDSAAVGTPPMAPGTPDRNDQFKGYYGAHPYFERLMQAVHAQEVADGKHYVDFIPTHTYAAAPGDETLDKYDWYSQRASQILGRNLNGLSTEGGPHPSTWNDPAVVGRMENEYSLLAQGKNRTECLWLQWGADDLTGRESWEKHNVFHDNPPGHEGEILNWLRSVAPH